MPKFRSITLSVVSQWEHRLHPEFPHPESQKFRVSNSMQGLSLSGELGFEESEEEVQEYTYSGEEREVSVYIPSCPGTRFWIRYAISPDHPPAKLFYFKLYLNGRHITSWGTNPEKQPQGQVMRALFTPELEESMDFRRPGIQSRPFYFAHQTEHDAALDGGLIEVLCFRAKGRRQIAPDTEDFRGGQEDYGLSLPKGDLLDCPQDARFYDWLLVDPKDSPYARFKFHYRAWENLVALSLIPAEVPPALLTRASSMWSVTRMEEREEDESILQPEAACSFVEFLDGESFTNVPEPCYNSRPLPAPGSHSSGRDNSVYDRPATPYANLSDPTRNRAVSERALPAPPAPGSRDNSVHDRPPTPYADLSNPTRSRAVSGRALPAPPAPGSYLSDRDASVQDRPPTPYADLSNPVRNRAVSERALPAPPKGPHPELKRVSSVVSTANSITPSLYSYVDRESSESPEPVIEVASAVPILYASSNYVENSYISFQSEGASQFSVESPQRGSPRRDNALGPSYGIMRPPEAMFSPASVAALRNLQNKDNYDSVPRKVSARMEAYYNDKYAARFSVENDHEKLLQEPHPGQLKIRTEHDIALEKKEQEDLASIDDSWVTQTPSPRKTNDEHIRVVGAADLGVDQSPEEVFDYTQSRERTGIPVRRPRVDSRQRHQTIHQAWI